MKNRPYCPPQTAKGARGFKPPQCPGCARHFSLRARHSSAVIFYLRMKSGVGGGPQI